MITASLKKKENIAEYLLYMWQIEDIIRASNFDMDKIDNNIISRYSNLTPEQKRDMYQWYESLIDMMNREDVREKGHLQINKNTLNDLADLHRRLLADSRFARYSAEFYNTLPYIVELRAKSGEEKAGEIESCFNALYGTLLLRLQKKEILPETQKAVAQISRFLATLAAYYKKDYNNELFNENGEVTDSQASAEGNA